ncbi:uncharacterized protein [Miscanthus floridulus]
MCIRQGHLECLLEYLDFPDERKTWTRLYKIPPGSHMRKSNPSRMIMVRPTFPQCYWENEKPNQLPKTHAVAIVTGPWKVGDLIDWWYTDCYWTGKIIELLGDDKVKIALHEEPIGEGGYYDADCKDLRPALDWSLEKGWSVPVSQDNGKCWYTAQLIIQRSGSGSSTSDEDIEQSCGGEEEVQKCLNGFSDVPAEAVDTDTKLSAKINDKIFMNNQGDGKVESPKCLIGASELPQEATNSKGDLPPNQNVNCCMKSGTENHIAKRGDSPEALLDDQSGPISLKRQKTSSEPATEVPPDTLDDAIMKLEKVANKIRHLESLVQSVGSPPSKVAKSSWKFLEDTSAKHK